MTNITSQVFEAYVPVYDVIPEKWDDARIILVEQLKRLANGVNGREISYFLDEELLAGKFFIPGFNNNQAFRSVLRTVVVFGALPNAGTKSVPHNITVDQNFSLIDLWASATKPTAAYSALNIPYASPTLNENIKINIDATNVNITTAINYSAYTVCYVVIEYIQEL